MSTLKSKLDLRNQFRSCLRELMSQRSQREEIVETLYGPECAWAAFERAEMLRLVNKKRAQRDKAPIDQETLDRVERMAWGHVNYMSKFALYCAELVLYEVEVRP